MSERSSDSDALRGRPVCVAAPKSIGGCGLTIFFPLCSIVLAATVQTAEVSGVWVPQIRAILDRMRLNFLSVYPWEPREGRLNAH